VYGFSNIPGSKLPPVRDERRCCTTPTEPGAAHRVLLVDGDGAVRAMMNEGLNARGVR
jgi:hypothetical protein